MERLRDKRALITGAAGGIGAAAARLFVAEGARVLLVDCDGPSLEKLAAELGSASSFQTADVCDPAQVESCVRGAVERLGGLDAFVNNAGIEGPVGPIDEYPVEDFDRVMAVNVRGAWLGLKYAMRQMRERGGSIVVTSSVLGLGGAPLMAAYTASKHAVVGLVRAAALEGAPQRIRVNAVNPGLTDTRMMRSLEEGIRPGEAGRAREGLLKRIPLQRYAGPEEVARLMLFLASDESSYCTGGVYAVDGGWTAQ